jgi:hypothetical protein
METPFRVRAKTYINSLVRQRLFLIKIGASRNDLKYDECRNFLAFLDMKMSDYAVASYLIKHKAFIKKIPVATDRKNAEIIDRMFILAEKINNNELIFS